MATLTVDADDIAELTNILDYLVGSPTTLITPATIVPCAGGDAYDLTDLRADITGLVERIGATPPPGSRRCDDVAELVAVNRGDLDDIAHILSCLEDFLHHSDDDTVNDLADSLNDNTTGAQSLARWIGEFASYLRRLLTPNPPPPTIDIHP
jgi:hypothetical protein